MDVFIIITSHTAQLAMHAALLHFGRARESTHRAKSERELIETASAAAAPRKNWKLMVITQGSTKKLEIDGDNPDSTFTREQEESPKHPSSTANSRKRRRGKKK